MVSKYNLGSSQGKTKLQKKRGLFSFFMIIRFTAPRSWKHGTERQTLMALSDLYASKCISSSYLRPVHCSISFITSLGLERRKWMMEKSRDCSYHTYQQIVIALCLLHDLPDQKIPLHNITMLKRLLYHI